jgi:hypothetical protein
VGAAVDHRGVGEDRDVRAHLGPGVLDLASGELVHDAVPLVRGARCEVQYGRAELGAVHRAQDQLDLSGSVREVDQTDVAAHQGVDVRQADEQAARARLDPVGETGQRGKALAEASVRTRGVGPAFGSESAGLGDDPEGGAA